MQQSHLKPVISGIGESQFARRLSIPFGELQLNAIEAAIADAGLTKDDIEGVFTDSAVMPGLFPIDAVVGALGLDNVKRIGSYSMGGAGIGYAAMEAAELVRAGKINAALIYFGVDWGSQSGGPAGFHERFSAKHWFEQPYGFHGQPLYFAAMARRYAYNHGLTDDELSQGMAHLAVNQRYNALKNPKSQMRKPLTLEEYLEAPKMFDPLRMFDCCLISDGAGAFIITSLERARDQSDRPLVHFLGGGYAQSAETTDPSCTTQGVHFPSLPTVGVAARNGFAQAGISPADLDFVEIYDCFTISVVLQLEQLGVCSEGEALEVIKAGTRIDASGLPINTHGGFLSHAYLLGINHVTEAVRQLRGEAGEGQVKDARLGAIQAGNPAREASMLLLGRD